MKNFKEHFKESAILFFMQLFLYGIVCINYRAVAQGNYIFALISDFLIASANYFVIRKISTSTDKFYQWMGYVLGSSAGSLIGIYLSKVLENYKF